MWAQYAVMGFAILFALAIALTSRAQSSGAFDRANRAGGFNGRAERGGFYR